jgi:hypothetical protein
MRLTWMSSRETAHEQAEAAREFARQAGFGLAGLSPGDLVPGNLTMVFALSAWLRTCDVDPVPACSGLLGLRQALLQTSGLEIASEPVPLLAGGHRNALLALSVYVHGLISRSAARAGKPAQTIVQEALELLP